MAIDDDECDERDFALRYGNDSTPLMASVRDEPPPHLGSITSTARTLSPQYLAFLKRHKEVRDGR